MVDEQVDLDEVGGGVALGLVVETGVSLGPALQLVEEVDDHLGQRDHVDELDALRREVLHLDHLGPAALAQVHDRPGVLGGRQDGGTEHRLVDMVEVGGLGELARVVHVDRGPVGQMGQVRDRGGGGDQGEVELALQALADDLHVQQAEEPAAEPETERP